MSSFSQDEPLPTAPIPGAFESNQRPTLAGDLIRRDTLSSSSSNASDEEPQPQASATLQRPKLGSRKSSTIIVPYDSPEIEVLEEEYDENDMRTMSPRRSIEEIEMMDQHARQALMDQAKALQASLLSIVDQVETVRSEHEKLEGGNRFLQSYIGELMQTSKITSTGGPKHKGKGRSTK